MKNNLQKVMARHPLYPKFCEWYQNHSDRVVKDITLLSYLSHLEHMRRNYGLDLDKPNLEKVIPVLHMGSTRSPFPTSGRDGCVRELARAKS